LFQQCTQAASDGPAIVDDENGFQTLPDFHLPDLSEFSDGSNPMTIPLILYGSVPFLPPNWGKNGKNILLTDAASIER
jgi:hypothetical protein